MSLTSLIGAIIIWIIGGFKEKIFEIEKENKYSVFVGLLFFAIIFGLIFLIE